MVRIPNGPNMNDKMISVTAVITEANIMINLRSTLTMNSVTTLIPNTKIPCAIVVRKGRLLL